MNRDLKKLLPYLKGIDLSIIRYLNENITPQICLAKEITRSGLMSQ